MTVRQELLWSLPGLFLLAFVGLNVISSLCGATTP